LEGDALIRDSEISFKLKFKFFKFSNSAVIFLFTSLKVLYREQNGHLHTCFVSAGPVAECCSVRKASEYLYL